ncbi:abortive infection system antitoxin AbiGi family protein [Stenotrophomonas maltophilia]|nr:hypothetical protein [Stenotrophomonas maltophilia]
MALSSNSLIHFTDSLENLLGIMEHGFRVKYCRENFSLKGDEEVLHVPMVSFCDIPFSQIRNHIESYGCYGVGLSKEWAIRNRLNPVLYVQSKSVFAESYYALMQYLHDKEKLGKLDKEPRRLGLEVVRYIKNYEGILRRKGKEPKQYRFSDEREWRYVPEENTNFPPIYTPEVFEAKTAEVANEGLGNLHLSFSPKDVSYIIISGDHEIKDVSAHLTATKDNEYTSYEKQLLMTRIITNEQIQGDF